LARVKRSTSVERRTRTRPGPEDSVVVLSMLLEICAVVPGEKCAV
jgi:hypothetical protein